MNKKWIAIGSCVSLLLVAVLGTALAAEESTSEQDKIVEATETQYNETVTPSNETDTQYLITQEQLNQIDAEMRELREQKINDTMLANLESYGLTDDQIMEIEEIMALIDDIRNEIMKTEKSLMDNGTNCSDMNDKLEPFMQQMQELQTELKDTLAQYGIEVQDCPPNPPGPPGHHQRNNMPGGPGFCGMQGGPEFQGMEEKPGFNNTQP